MIPGASSAVKRPAGAGAKRRRTVPDTMLWPMGRSRLRTYGQVSVHELPVPSWRRGARGSTAPAVARGSRPGIRSRHEPPGRSRRGAPRVLHGGTPSPARRPPRGLVRRLPRVGDVRQERCALAARGRGRGPRLRPDEPQHQEPAPQPPPRAPRDARAAPARRADDRCRRGRAVRLARPPVRRPRRLRRELHPHRGPVAELPHDRAGRRAASTPSGPSSPAPCRRARYEGSLFEVRA